eukprot:GGOE01053464.1.p1 GENE.GGOE01053464.1~~GGOE01053464.1.p1  ORF type:complete len:457 (+),score=71.06 GGOE01053464.1:138-1508(+)
MAFRQPTLQFSHVPHCMDFRCSPPESHTRLPAPKHMSLSHRHSGFPAVLGALGTALVLYGVFDSSASQQIYASPSLGQTSKTLPRSSLAPSSVISLPSISRPVSQVTAAGLSTPASGPRWGGGAAGAGALIQQLWPVAVVATLALAAWLAGTLQRSPTFPRQEAALFAVASKQKKSTKVKPKKPSIDTKALLRQSEKEHEKLCSTYGHDTSSDIVLAEYIVAARSKATGKAEPSLSGWVPICSTVVVANTMAQKQLRKPVLIAHLCREFSETLAQISPVLRAYPRKDLEYSLEPWSSFDTYVLNRKSTKDAALFAELGLQPGADSSDIKAAYRKLASQLHPDLHRANPAVQEANSARMRRIQEAYTALGGGYGESRDCWYASLGGRARTEFSGVVDLSGVKMGGELLGLDLPFELGGLRCAVSPLPTHVPAEFLQMNVMRHHQATVAAAQAADGKE